MRGPRQHGFSLVELLVVLSIIGLLISLLLPALQYAREAARLAQCRSNLRQIGFALHSYHIFYDVFPPGHIQNQWPPTTLAPSQRTTWLPMILGELADTSVYNAFNFDLGLLGPGSAGIVANSTVHATRLPMLLCPSDTRRVQDDTATPFWRQKGNYAVNWGNTTWWQIDLPGNSFRRAPFGTNSRTSLGDIVDGTSHTLLLSELIATKHGDFRGDVWNDDAGTSQFYTTIPPNSPLPDQLGTPWCQSLENPPCVNVPEPRDQAFAAARSRHPRGVNILLADGSSRFVSDVIDGELWKALGSMSSQEFLEDF